MSYNTGEYVVYAGTEICLISEIVNRCFDGIRELDYYKLIPESPGNSSYYIPYAGFDEKVRPLLTQEEIYSIIDDMPALEKKWIINKNERLSVFIKTLRSDDYRKLIGLMKGIYAEQQKRNSDGKKLTSSDEKALIEAQKLMHKEFSLVLGIKEEDVHSFIESRLNGSTKANSV